MQKKNWNIFYPLLWGIYPVIGLISVNINQMDLISGMHSILIAAIFALAVYALFCWRISDEHKAALMSAWFTLFFFTYGHVYQALKSVNGFDIGRHRFLFPAWLVLFGMGAWLIYKKIKCNAFLSRILNIVGVILVIMPVIQIISVEWQRNNLTHSDDSDSTSIQAGVTLSQEEHLPDVYYIILDSYSRRDVLNQNYQLDISEFIGQLEEIGFYVLPCSQSNYGITDLSLASSLNMNYIEGVAPPMAESQSSWVPLGEPIRYSLVRQMFEGMGYQIVAFESGVWWSEMEDADIYFRGTNNEYEISINSWSLNAFDFLFLRTTILRFFLDVSNAWTGTFYVDSLRGHAEYIEYTLGELETVPQITGPKFVFVHLMAPHEPYVFDPDGVFVFTEAADPGYPNEIQYLNKRLVPLVQKIIEESSVPPIIIIQGDHARDAEVRLAIFNAIYFPNAEDVLYPTMTPVNTFRLVFNTYFGQDFTLLPDISYYSSYGHYYEFTEVTYPCTP